VAASGSSCGSSGSSNNSSEKAAKELQRVTWAEMASEMMKDSG
jgi:hypothetical protein